MEESLLTKDRRALCVGINKFRNYPERALKGCVNDSKDISLLLKQSFGFEDTDITILNDAQATKENIMKNLVDMVQGATSGQYNYIFFSLSTHGTQIPDGDDGDEPDHADEAFVPYDIMADSTGLQWDLNHIIVDDELRELFAQLPQHTLLEVFLDTCHSGTGIKGFDFLLDRMPRYLPPPSFEGFNQVLELQNHGLREGLLEKGLHNHVLWAACKPNQTSSDAFFAVEEGWHGAFTYYFCRISNKSNARPTRREVINTVRKALKPRFEQVPQLECDSTHKGKYL
jgi:hypothetical protein